MSELGTLEDVRLAEVLRVFSQAKKTGLLSVQDGQRQARLQLQKGHIVFAACGRFQGREAVLDVFGWRSGQVAFLAAEPTLAANVSEPTDKLIDEAQQVGATFHRMQEVLTSDRLVFQWSAGAPPDDLHVTLGPLEWRLLRAVDGIRDVRDVLESAKVTRGEGLPVLFALIESGLVERAEIPRAVRIQAHGLFGKDVAEGDDGLLADWRRNLRFAHGVFRIEVRASSGGHVAVPVTFRSGLGRELVLPRPLLGELGAQEGDEVFVRPIA
jgi:hypothetical protein